MEAKKLTFAPYAKDDWRAAPRRIFDILWGSVHNPNWRGSDDKDQRAMVGLLNAIESVCDKESEPGADQFILKVDGASLVLQHAEFDLLKAAWNVYKPNLPNALARERLLVEDFLNGAEVVKLEVAAN